jgi:hypothetical protein
MTVRNLLLLLGRQDFGRRRVTNPKAMIHPQVRNDNLLSFPLENRA